MSGRDPIEFRVSNNCRGAETSRRCDVTPSRGVAKLKLHAAARRRQAETTGLHGTVARRANIDDEVTVHDRGNALDEQSSDERAYVRTSLRHPCAVLFFAYFAHQDTDEHLKPRFFTMAGAAAPPLLYCVAREWLARR
jgi:hypothetical protein